MYLNGRGGKKLSDKTDHESIQYEFRITLIFGKAVSKYKKMESIHNHVVLIQ